MTFQTQPTIRIGSNLRDQDPPSDTQTPAALYYWTYGHYFGHQTGGQDWHVQAAYYWGRAMQYPWAYEPASGEHIGAWVVGNSRVVHVGGSRPVAASLQAFGSKDIHDFGDVVSVLVRSAIESAARSRKLTTPEQASTRYVQLVKKMPEVQEVRLSQDEEGPSIWTIIAATPFDEEPRERIINVQIEVMRAMVQPLLGFNLVNLRELEAGVVVDSVMGEAQVLWKR